MKKIYLILFIVIESFSMNAQKNIQYVYEITLFEKFRHTANWSDAEHQIQQKHISYLTSLASQGTIEVAGIQSQGLAEHKGVILLNVENYETALKIALDDPSVKQGMMTASVYPFRTYFKGNKLENRTSDFVINGTNPVGNSKEIGALNEFYKAFNGRDVKLMQQCWLNTPDISMDNPIGGIRRGWEEIRYGYEKIFKGTATVYVEFYDYTIHTTPTMFFATGRERGYFRNSNKQISLDIRTSRIFILENGNWKQIHHHGSIDDPQLLDSYQQSIK